MHRSLLPVLRDPASGDVFELVVFDEGSIGSSPKQIISGLLRGQESDYPIINGVPRILEPTLLSDCVRHYPEFIKSYSDLFRHPIVLSNAPHSAIDLARLTQKRFGTQWNTFNEIYPEWRTNFEDYLFPLLKIDDFKERRVLDCGCGFGRHMRLVAEAGAEIVVGIDISQAVDSSILNVSSFSNAHVVQTDIRAIPLSGGFDFVYSIGVIDHSVDPHAATTSIADQADDSGAVFIWVYGYRSWPYHLTVDSLRRITRNFNSTVLYYLTLALALVTYSLFAFPRIALRRMGLERLGGLIPFSRYADYPFRVSHADWFDRLSSPVTTYFTEEGVRGLFSEARAKSIQIVPRTGGTWRALLKKELCSI